MDSRIQESAEIEEISRRLEHNNRVLKAVRKINRLVFEAKDQKELLQGVCDCLSNTTDYLSAWIALFDKEWKIIASAESGHGEHFHKLQRIFKTGSLPQCVQELRDGARFLSNRNPEEVCPDCPLASSYAKRTVIAANVMNADNIHVLLNVSVPLTQICNEEDYDILIELAKDVGYGLSKLKQDKLLLETQELLLESQKIACVGSWSLDVRSGSLQWTDEVYRIFGCSPQTFKVSDSAFFDLVHPDDRERVQESYSNSVESRSKGYEIEHRIVRKNTGEIRFVHEKCIHIKDAQGNVARSLGMVKDITEEKHHHLQLVESEERFRSTIEDLQVGVVVHKADTSILLSNRQASKMLGISEEDLSGKDVWSPDWCFVREDLSLMDVSDYPVSKVIATRTRQSDLTLGIQRPDQNEIIWIMLSAAPIFDEGGELQRIVVNFIDITEQKRIKDEFKSNYELLQIAGETSKFGGWVVDIENNICVWSDIVADIHEEPRGYKPPVEEGISYYAPEWQEKITEVFTACAERGIPYDEELEIITKKGNRLWVRTCGRAVKNDEKKIIKVEGSFQDISEQKRTELELERLVEYERLLADISTDLAGLKIEDVDSAIVKTLSRLCEFTESDRAYVFQFKSDFSKVDNTHEYCGEGIEPQIQNLKDISLEDEMPWFSERIKKAESIFIPDVMDMPEEALLSQQAFLKQDIRSLIVVPIRTADNLIGFMGFDRVRSCCHWTDDHKSALQYSSQILSNVIELKNSEETLRNSEKNFHSIIETLPLAIYLSSGTDEICRYMNPFFTKLLGYTIEDVPAVAHWYPLAYPDAEYRKEVELEWTRKAQKAVDTHSSVEPMETMVTCKDGSTKNILWGFITIGENNYVYGLDLTDRKQAENRIRKANEELAAANLQLKEATATKSAFLANMSHEIRTPMNAVVGMTDLLMETELDPEQRESVDIIQVSSAALMLLINDILDFSKIEAGQVELELREFDLGKCIKESFGLIAVSAAAKNISLKREIDENVPYFIRGDAGRLQQILVNLLSNAVKFTKEGEIHLSVTARAHEHGHEIEFEVRDTGIGIAPDKLDSIFSEFTQADTSTTRQYGGTGLGLTISKKLSELMNGRLWVESAPGEGSTFRFTILSLDTKSKTIPTDQSGLEASNSGLLVENKKEPSLNSLRILIAEDNQLNQQVAMRMLDKIGYQADLAADGQEAVEMAQNKDYDLILMDVQMPVMDGLTATKRLISLCNEKDRPVIVGMTAQAFSEERERGLAAGMDEYIIKPLPLAKLKETLRNVEKSKFS